MQVIDIKHKFRTYAYSIRAFLYMNPESTSEEAINIVFKYKNQNVKNLIMKAYEDLIIEGINNKLDRKWQY